MCVKCMICNYRVMSARATQTEGDPEAQDALARWAAVEDNFGAVSAQAWNAVLAQVREANGP